MKLNGILYIFVLVQIVFSETKHGKNSSSHNSSKSEKKHGSVEVSIKIRDSMEPEFAESDSMEALNEDDFKNAEMLSNEEINHNPANPSSTCMVHNDNNGKDFKLREAMWENDHLYWNNHRIPYQILGNFSKKERALLAKSIKKFENSSCLKFPPKTRDDTHFFTFIHGDECKVKKRSRNDFRMVIMNEKCIAPRTIQHNIMHILGFSHEHTRSDRDKYVDINWNNIVPDKKRYFFVTKNNLLGEPYDYDSIMHVAENYHSSNPDQPTIIPKKEGITIGRSRKLSSGDAAKIKKLFRCS
ncbi:zinc metalloproteinase nas-7-like [Brevipalpus obovatus]|uniref:zinc metalloproteinase nas-7-like n=1 Tax=Brevipalpus obovatus TaxID=246614 RepID=UPI003D9E302A